MTAGVNCLWCVDYNKWARREKTCRPGFANNTGADQPAHPRKPINAFVIRFWKVLYSTLLQVKFQIPSYSL